jgi:hypothetical protein
LQQPRRRAGLGRKFSSPGRGAAKIDLQGTGFKSQNPAPAMCGSVSAQGRSKAEALDRIDADAPWHVEVIDSRASCQTAIGQPDVAGVVKYTAHHGIKIRCR